MKHSFWRAMKKVSNRIFYLLFITSCGSNLFTSKLQKERNFSDQPTQPSSLAKDAIKVDLENSLIYNIPMWVFLLTELFPSKKPLLDIPIFMVGPIVCNIIAGILQRLLSQKKFFEARHRLIQSILFNLIGVVWIQFSLLLTYIGYLILFVFLRGLIPFGGLFWSEQPEFIPIKELVPNKVFITNILLYLLTSIILDLVHPKSQKQAKGIMGTTKNHPPLTFY